MKLWNPFRRGPKADEADAVMREAAEKIGLSAGRLDELVRKYGSETQPAGTALAIRQQIVDGQFEAALRSADAYLGGAPNDAEVLACKINALMNLERNEEARQFGESALRRCPNDAEIHCVIGLTHNKLKNLDQAAERFRAALALDARHVRSLIGLGDCLVFQRKYEEAASSYREALAIDPSDGMAWVHLGLSLYNLDALDAALEAVNKGIELWPGHPTAKMLRARIELSRGIRQQR